MGQRASGPGQNAGPAHFLCPGCVTGEREERSLVATNGTKGGFSRRPFSPHSLKPHVLHRQVASTWIPPRLSSLLSTHRAPAADTWRLRCRSSKPALAWCLVPCTCPTVTAKGSTRESRYAPVPCPQVQRKTSTREPRPLNA